MKTVNKLRINNCFFKKNTLEFIENLKLLAKVLFWYNFTLFIIIITVTATATATVVAVAVVVITVAFSSNFFKVFTDSLNFF